MTYIVFGGTLNLAQLNLTNTCCKKFVFPSRPNETDAESTQSERNHIHLYLHLYLILLDIPRKVLINRP